VVISQKWGTKSVIPVQGVSSPGGQNLDLPKGPAAFKKTRTGVHCLVVDGGMGRGNITNE